MSENSSRSLGSRNSQLTVRLARHSDVAQIVTLSDKVYEPEGMLGCSSGSVHGQINNFPEGQFVVCLDERVIGYCATFRIRGEIALKPHTWESITGNGYASRHDPQGEWLYGMEVYVDPDYRGYRIGQRLYNARKRLCQDLGLRGIVFGGRLPTLARRMSQVESVEAYVEQIVQKRRRDPVLSFQLRNGFEVIGVLPRYLPSDRASLGYAVHLIWRNPKVADEDVSPQGKNYGVRPPDSVRVGTVQYMQRRVSSFEEFVQYVEYFVDVVADYKGDFVVFPELFTLQLLSLEERELTPAESIEALTKYTPRFKEAMRDMALRYNVNIIAGSHPTRVENGRVENIAYICLRNGQVHAQPKIHPTPNEVYWWNLEGGDTLNVIDTDCGPIGVLICYDSEFPELARRLVDEGARIIFVPFCTDSRQGYMRVRYCCAARAIENQCFVVMSGNVGNLPNVANMDIQYAQSCILTPCDFPFARDGIAAEATENVETLTISDVNLADLSWARAEGTVRNLADRRFDLYRIGWSEDSHGGGTGPDKPPTIKGGPGGG